MDRTVGLYVGDDGIATTKCKALAIFQMVFRRKLKTIVKEIQSMEIRKIVQVWCQVDDFVWECFICRAQSKGGLNIDIQLNVYLAIFSTLIYFLLYFRATIALEFYKCGKCVSSYTKNAQVIAKSTDILCRTNESATFHLAENFVASCSCSFK